MKLKKVLEEDSEWQSKGPTTSYMGKWPGTFSVYNWGYKGYYPGEEPALTAALDDESQNQLIDQAIDLMYSRFPEIMQNKKMKRHMLQMIIGQITQGELKDRVEMDNFIKRLKKTKGVETV